MLLDSKDPLIKKFLLAASLLLSQAGELNYLLH